MLEFLNKKSVKMRQKIMTKHCLFGAPNLRHSRKNLNNRWLWWLRHLECLSASAPDPNSLRTTHSGQAWPGLRGLLWYGGMVVRLIRHCTLCSTQNVFEVVSTFNGWALAHWALGTGHWAPGTGHWELAHWALGTGTLAVCSSLSSLLCQQQTQWVTTATTLYCHVMYCQVLYCVVMYSNVK